MIQDLSGSWCIKGTGESTLVMDSPVPLMHHDPDRSWITDPDPDHPKGTQPISLGLITIWFSFALNAPVFVSAFFSCFVPVPIRSLLLSLFSVFPLYVC